MTSAHPFRTARKFNKKTRNVKAILSDEQKYVANAAPDAPTYFNISAGPSLQHQKAYCDITGLPAPYKNKAGVKYHNVEIYEIVNSLRSDAENEYLRLRNAHVVLR